MQRSSASAASSTGQNFGSSRYSPWVWLFDHEAVELRARRIARSISLAARLGLCGANACQAGKTRRIFAADLGEAVVCRAGKLGRRIGIEHLHAGSGQREQVHVDAELIHLRQALALDIQQAFEN